MIRVHYPKGSLLGFGSKPSAFVHPLKLLLSSPGLKKPAPVSLDLLRDFVTMLPHLMFGTGCLTKGNGMCTIPENQRYSGVLNHLTLMNTIRLKQV